MDGETQPLTGGRDAEVALVDGELAPGTVLGDWRIEERIGQGGMGIVYAAIHGVIGKRAAIKVVRAELCRSPLTAERFVQEARVVNQIGHPNIVDIFHIGRLGDGRPYLVMELLHGCTLADRLAAGRMSAAEAIDVLLQVVAGLAAAHEHGVVHRDLKPDNIFLTDGGDRTSATIVDWGIAKLTDTAPLAPAMTTTGMMMGTPQYVSPEQARGRKLDARTDIYSLGAIAYETFLEGPPFVADNAADVVAMHLREPPPPPSDVWPDVPASLERLLLAMLAKEPDARPSLSEIAMTLELARGDLGTRRVMPRGTPRAFTIEGPIITAESPVFAPAPVHARWPWVIAAILVAAAAIAAIAVFAGRAEPARAREADVPPKPIVTRVPMVTPVPVVEVAPRAAPASAPLTVPAVAPTRVPVRTKRAAVAAPAAAAKPVPAPAIVPTPTPAPAPRPAIDPNATIEPFP